MKTKIKSLIALLMLSGALLTILFALPNPQPKDNPQTEPKVTVPRHGLDQKRQRRHAYSH